MKLISPRPFMGKGLRPAALILALVMLTWQICQAKPPQFSIRTVGLVTTCAAFLTTYIVAPRLEEARYQAYARPELVSPNAPVAILRGVIAGKIGTALATHGHFLSFEDAVAIAVDLDLRDGAAIRQRHPDWTPFVERIEAEGFDVQIKADDKLQIAYPQQRESKRTEVFVEALLTMQLSKELRRDPAAPPLVSVENLVLYANPYQSEMVPMNVVKLFEVTR